MSQGTSIEEIIVGTSQSVIKHFENQEFPQILKLTNKLLALLEVQPIQEAPTGHETQSLIHRLVSTLEIPPTPYAQPSLTQDQFKASLDSLLKYAGQQDAYEFSLTSLRLPVASAENHFIAAQLAREFGYGRAALRLTEQGLTKFPHDAGLRALKSELALALDEHNQLIVHLRESLELRKLLHLSVLASLHQNDAQQALEWAEILFLSAPKDSKLAHLFLTIYKRQVDRGSTIDSIETSTHHPTTIELKRDSFISTPKLHIVKGAKVFGHYGLISPGASHHIQEFGGSGPDRAKICSGIIGEIATPGIAKRHGTWLPLYDLFSENFWHWIFEALPKVVIAEASGFSGNYLLPRTEGFHSESMKLLGVSDERCFRYDLKNWEADNIAVVQAPHHSETNAILELVRKSLLQSLPQTNSGEITKRICIARKSRDFVNADEVRRTVENYGFQWIHLEDFSFSEQLNIVRNAEAVIGAHGAGMSHALFMRPSSLVIECFSPLYFNPCLKPVIKLLRHQYHMLPSRGPFDEPYPHGRRVNVPINFLELCLETELQRPR